jgi:hypothetical protein
VVPAAHQLAVLAVRQPQGTAVLPTVEVLATAVMPLQAQAAQAEATLVPTVELLVLQVPMAVTPAMLLVAMLRLSAATAAAYLAALAVQVQAAQLAEMALVLTVALQEAAVTLVPTAEPVQAAATAV